MYVWTNNSNFYVPTCSWVHPVELICSSNFSRLSGRSLSCDPPPKRLSSPLVKSVVDQAREAIVRALSARDRAIRQLWFTHSVLVNLVWALQIILQIGWLCSWFALWFAKSPLESEQNHIRVICWEPFVLHAYCVFVLLNLVCADWAHSVNWPQRYLEQLLQNGSITT